MKYNAQLFEILKKYLKQDTSLKYNVVHNCLNNTMYAFSWKNQRERSITVLLDSICNKNLLNKYLTQQEIQELEQLVPTRFKERIKKYIK